MVSRNLLFAFAVLHLSSLLAFSSPEENLLYIFNNATTSLTNVPDTKDEQALALKTLGFDGISSRAGDNFPERKKSAHAAGLAVPEIYLHLHLEREEKPKFNFDLKQLIADAGTSPLLIALTVRSETFSSDRKAGDRQLVQVLRDLSLELTGHPIKIALYPHADFYCETVDHSVTIAERVDRPNVGAIFNLCHHIKVKGSAKWAEALTQALPHLFMISLNGCDEGPAGTMDWNTAIQPLGQGSLDTYPVYKLAKDAGYTGPFGIQCYEVNQDFHKTLHTTMSVWRSYQKRYLAEN